MNQDPVPVEGWHGLLDPCSIRIIMTSEDKRGYYRTISRIGLALLRRSNCTKIRDGGYMKVRRVTGAFRLVAALFCCAAPIAAANAGDRIAIKIDVIGPLGMRVLEMHSLLEADENPGRYA